jgi:DNA-nicking Smr family endonuclease
MRRLRRPTPEESALWAQAMRGTRPLPGRVLPPPATPPRDMSDRREPPLPTPQPAVTTEQHTAARQASAMRSMRLDPTRPIDIDRRTWDRLRRGELPIATRLDLHGLTQTQAHERLQSFLSRARRDGARCVLVITGRGSSGGGVLRTMTPRWLDEPPLRDHVVAFAQASPSHGGAGALYVLLRRRPPGA